MNNHKLLTSNYSSVLFLAFLFLFSLGVQGQNFQTNALSVTLKAGAYDDINSSIGASLGFDLDLRSKDLIYTLGLTLGEELTSLKSPKEQFKQIGFMVGKYHKLFSEKTRYGYQAGVATFWGTQRGDLIQSIESSNLVYSTYEVEKFFTAGLLLNFEAHFLATKWLSIGGSLHGNINPEKIIYMPMLEIQLGRIR